jgi:hypothetical protein
MGGIKMKHLSNADLKTVSGGDWDSFWDSVGETIGSWVAADAYSMHSKSLHDIGTGNGGSLDDFLSNQNDPLL